MRQSVMSLIDRLVSWKKHRQIRAAARKYNLDFEHGCLFDEQLRPYGYPKHGELCVVDMQSGKKALYKATVTKVWSGDTGQKSWRFEFQGYVN